jgi:four helix bundle protein
MGEGYFELKNLVVYQLACEIGDKSWPIYDRLDWQIRKIMGDQFIRSADSISANIAEGYGRFHYLDKTSSIIMRAAPIGNIYDG